MKRSLFSLRGLSLVFLVGCYSMTQAKEKPNILLIAVDDLRPQLGCYGQEEMISPNIDKLAGEGVLFKEAYSQVPTCGASRGSFLTGLWPSPIRFLTYKIRADVDAVGIIDLPGWLKQHGYHTTSLGKVYHHADDNKASWDEIYRPNGVPQYFSQENLDLIAEGKRGAAFEAPEVEDDSTRAGKITLEAIKQLRDSSNKDEPFFLAVGFFKPHLPFVAPKKYWDLYDADSLKMAENPYLPEGAPSEANYTWGEMRSYSGIPKQGPVSTELNRKLIHGYRASVSFTDALIGRILSEVDALGLRDDTVVILWSDHGWQLGEHGFWCKHVTFRTSLQIPLLVRAPGLSVGKETTGLVSSVDVFPTICELVGLPEPDHLQGTSFAKLLKHPNGPGKEFTYSRFRDRDAIRTGKYLYTEWRKEGEVVARMLYDHEMDPDENSNISERPEHLGMVRQLSKKLAGQIEFVTAN